MALGACPECGGTVSTAAATCPHCGHPLVAPAGTGSAARGQPAASIAGAPLVGGVGAEQVLWQGTPSLRILTAEGLRTLLFVTLVIGGTVWAFRPLLEAVARLAERPAGFVAEYQPGIRLAATVFVVMVVGLRIGRLGWRILALRHQSYRVTNQRLTLESGVLSKALNEIDMRTIDDIALRQSAFERLLKVGRIEILSSDPRGAAAAMPGGLGGATAGKTRLALIGIPEPRAVREVIRGAAYQATHGQLFTRAT